MLGYVLTFVAWILGKLPLGVAYRFADFLAWLWRYVLRIRLGTIRDQVSEAIKAGGLDPRSGESKQECVERITNGCILNLTRGLIEFCQMSRLIPLCLRKEPERLIVHGEKSLRAALGQGMGMLALTAHLGNWDLLACSQAASGLPLSIVTRRSKNRHVNGFWMKSREAFGVGMFADRNSKEQILTDLRGGGITGFVLDQHMPPNHSTPVEFLGRLCSATPGLAALHLDSSAPVVPVFLIRTSPGRFEVRFEEPVEAKLTGDRERDIRTLTQTYTDIIDRWVRRHPEQWLWVHRRWKPFPDTRQHRVVK